MTTSQDVRIRTESCSLRLQAPPERQTCGIETVHVHVQAPPDRQARGSETTTTEVIVIGSGVGGLSCGALLAKYGVKVTVLESHDIPGGAAHSWVQKGYHFESGPSLYSDMASRGDT